MDLAVIFAAAEHVAEHKKSEVPFFVMGALFASYAVLVSVYGFKRPDFPTTAGAARAVMSVGAMLMMAAVGTAIYVGL
jgi:hypothetical protein